MNKAFLIFVIFLISACHPLSMFKPPAIKLNSSAFLARTEAGTASEEVAGSVRVAIDEHGIPFIKANTIENAMYGLGFMHARDRLFQLDLMRHTALGRTAELFGERSIIFDRKLRI